MADSAPQVIPPAVIEDTKEKEAREKAAKDTPTPIAAPTEPTAGITRTFTTHAGETITVTELSNAAKHEDAIATIPEAEPVNTHEQVSKAEPVKERVKIVPVPAEIVSPATAKVNVPAPIPETEPIFVEKQDHAEKTTPIEQHTPPVPLPESETTDAEEARMRQEHYIAALKGIPIPQSTRWKTDSAIM